MKSRSGFTLLEILVAVSLLIIIVLIMSGIFQQSTIAWESGIRKTELNMEGRAALNLMADELGMAVASGSNLTVNIRNGSAIQFWTLGEVTDQERSVRKVAYRLNNGSVERLYERMSAGGTPYPLPIPGAGWETLIENVDALEFGTPGGVQFTNRLPPWIDVKLTIRKSSKFSSIRISSDGADGTDNTDDDIRNWENTF